MHKIILSMCVLSLRRLISNIIGVVYIIRETQYKVTPCRSKQSGLHLHLLRVIPQSLSRVVFNPLNGLILLTLQRPRGGPLLCKQTTLSANL